MENNESKAKYVGEIAVLLFLEIIMLLFRLVQPIHWPSQVPANWQNLLNEFAFFGIELGLIVVIVAHFIYKISFRDLGLKRFKENIAPLIMNLCFVGICVAAAFVGSQFSKTIQFNGQKVALQIVVNFIAIAFLKELIFRGFLFNEVLKLTGGKGILASFITAACFTLTYIPTVLISLTNVQGMAVLSALVGPFLFGLYLSLLYYYGRNLWICTIIHGVCLTIASFEVDIFITLLAGVYILGLLIYLVYKIITYYRHDEEEEETEEEMAADLQLSKAEAEIEEVDQDAVSEEVEHETVAEDELESSVLVSAEAPIEVSGADQEEVDKEEEQVTEASTSGAEPGEFLRLQADLEKKMQQIEEERQEKAKVIEIPAFKNLKSLSEEETENNPSEDEDLEHMTDLSNTKEELSKVVHLQARKAQLAKADHFNKTLEDTAVLPGLSEEIRRQEILNPLKVSDMEAIVEAEPNFIEHLEKYLGEFEGIYKQVLPTEPPIDMMYFVGEKYNSLVTNGMRAVAMSVPSELSAYKRAELMMFADKSFDLSGEGLQNEQNAWLVKLLTDLAIYPSQTNSYLGCGHTLGNGEDLEPYDESIDYCGALIYSPIGEEEMNLQHYVEKEESICIYNVMPLFKDELKFIEEHSSEAFIQIMCEMGVSQVVKPHRVNMIEEMK